MTIMTEILFKNSAGQKNNVVFIKPKYLITTLMTQI